MYNNSNELLHYGVLGMKWGRRSGGVHPTNNYRSKEKRHNSILSTKKQSIQKDLKVAKENWSKLSNTQKAGYITKTGAAITAGVLAGHFGSKKVYSLTGSRIASTATQLSLSAISAYAVSDLLLQER